MQRNGQNPIRKVGNYEHGGGKTSGPSSAGGRAAGAGICPSCGAEVPPKPGFRFSSLKCPKCGTSMGKK
jgi:hypothetical protein